MVEQNWADVRAENQSILEVKPPLNERKGTQAPILIQVHPAGYMSFYTVVQFESQGHDVLAVFAAGNQKPVAL